MLVLGSTGTFLVSPHMTGSKPPYTQASFSPVALLSASPMDIVVNAAAQQARFDRFLSVYNEERPHEALGQIPPARIWRPGSRPYPSQIEALAYDNRHDVRRVRSTGEIRWRGELVFLTGTLVGEIVGIREVADGSWVVRFATLDIGVIEHKTMKLRRFTAPRPGRREAPNSTKSVTHHPGLFCYLSTRSVPTHDPSAAV